MSQRGNIVNMHQFTSLFHLTAHVTLLLPEKKIAESANRVDLHEVAHNEPPHQDPHCLPSSL